MKGKRDHDATSMLTKGKAEMASARISRDVSVLRAKTERTKQELDSFYFKKAKGRSLFVDYVAAPGTQPDQNAEIA